MCDQVIAHKLPVIVVLLCVFSAICAQLPFDDRPGDRNYDRTNDRNYDRTNDRNYDRTNDRNYDRPQDRPFEDRQFEDNRAPEAVERTRFRGDIRSLLQQLDLQASQQCTNNVAAQWNFETNINQLTQLEAVGLKFIILIRYFIEINKLRFNILKVEK